MRNKSLQPSRETDDQRPPPKAKRAWSKPTVRKMIYVNIADTGPRFVPGVDELPRYTEVPTS